MIPFAAAKGALLFANLLIPCAIFIFASGFFPYKPFLPGLATFSTAQHDSRPSPPFDKLVFMVVDALRSDFVYSSPSGFRFTQSLIRSGSALPFTAHASSPTITMPRVKAITTGSVPSFLDVILNFAESEQSSTLAHQDTWLAQIRTYLNASLVFYGDDTWLKLFPGYFARADGTSSFFVSDFTEVDNNVTRHVPDELVNDDWAGMVLHYLGLDHIGHKSGPRSPHMLPKQEEMDSIVQQIYTAIETRPHLSSCLLVLCGDHGMNDAGNHGGSSPGETSPALVFMSPKLKGISTGTGADARLHEDFQYYNVVEQSDIAPTLAGLLGFPIPLNNLGVFIPELLALWDSDAAKLDVMLSNARQIMRVVKQTFPSSAPVKNQGKDRCNPPFDNSIDGLDCEWQNVNTIVQTTKISGSDFREAFVAILVFCRKLQEIMSGTASSYDIAKLQLGIGVASLATVSASLSSFEILRAFRFENLVFTTTGLSFAGMMIASSYVEEEHQFWYWSLEAWLLLLYIKESQDRTRSPLFPGVYSVLLIVSSRFVRRWNQTGQKFAGEPSIVTSFYTDHTLTFWILLLTTYADVCQRLSRDVFAWASHSLSIVLATALTSFAFLFKVAFTFADAPELFRGIPALTPLIAPIRDSYLTPFARLIFVSLALSLVAARVLSPRAVTTGPHPKHVLLGLLLLTQSRATNIPLFLLASIQLHCLKKILSPSAGARIPVLAITTSSLILQHAFFFASGGSNAISSVDLSSAYNGVSGYNVLIVAMLTFVSNWAGPIWWVSGAGVLFGECRRKTKSHSQMENRSAVGKVAMARNGLGLQYIALTTLFTSMALLGVMVACSVLRTHLFIWTVFSPKYLYSVAWCLGQHLLVNVAGGLAFDSQDLGQAED